MLYGYVSYRIFISNRELVSVMILPLVLGIALESKRLSASWKTILLKIHGALLLSAITFIPFKGEQYYDFEAHIEVWQYGFVFFFAIISMIYHDKKVIIKLTEGITLLQSISIIYWILDVGILNFNNSFSYFMMGVGLIFCSISLFHAFSYKKLTKKARLTLSIWSSIIMIVFAIDHIYQVFTFNGIDNYIMLSYLLGILQYFLLGVSLIYILQNAHMLFVYLPSKNRVYNKSHLNEIRKMNKVHIKRYSETQIKILDSAIALIFTTGVYFLNYKMQIMPRNTLIWMVFWSLPLVISFKDHFVLNRFVKRL